MKSASECYEPSPSYSANGEQGSGINSEYQQKIKRIALKSLVIVSTLFASIAAIIPGAAMGMVAGITFGFVAAPLDMLKPGLTKKEKRVMIPLAWAIGCMLGIQGIVPLGLAGIMFGGGYAVFSTARLGAQILSQWKETSSGKLSLSQAVQTCGRTVVKNLKDAVKNLKGA